MYFYSHDLKNFLMEKWWNKFLKEVNKYWKINKIIHIFLFVNQISISNQHNVWKYFYPFDSCSYFYSQGFFF